MADVYSSAAQMALKRRVAMLELSLWVLGGVVVLGLIACRLARKPRRQHDMELIEFDFDKSKSYEKDGRKYPFSY
jgi:beta-lactamase regulating signal transducer with metallopeptidase domain